jgi:hypothetical protein
MYLEARRFVSGYSHSGEEENQLFNDLAKTVGMEQAHDERYITVNVNVAYWRKANAIHEWFVKNVQDGEDDCKSHYVSRDMLRELHDVCRKVVEAGTQEVAQELLPTASGFFFGDTEYGEYYFEQVDWTAKRLAEILRTIPEKSGMTGVDFYYNSSW